MLHNDIVKLNTTIKSINLALKWVQKKIDSTIALNWIRTAITEHRRVKTKGAAEMIILRRMGILKELIAELELEVLVV